MAEEVTMKKLQFGTNFTVFILFFGIATLEAFAIGDWLMTAFWVVVALVFLWADGKEGAVVNNH